MDQTSITSFTKSESIGALAAALAKAQGEMSNAKKDTLNPFFKSKYADLASVWDVCREVLPKNNLAVIQTCGTKENEISVHTILAHSSGEWVSGSISVKIDKATPQALGSAISYFRRYGIAAMVGVATEDDDGNSSSAKQVHIPFGTDSAHYDGNSIQTKSVGDNQSETTPQTDLSKEIMYLKDGTKKTFEEYLKDDSVNNFGYAKWIHQKVQDPKNKLALYQKNYLKYAISEGAFI